MLNRDYPHRPMPTEPAPQLTTGFWYDGAWQSGQTIQLSISDPGLLYGATLFSTLRVYDQNLDHPATAWAAHCNRLQQSLQALQWQAPNWQRLRTGAIAVMAHWPVLRLTLFPDGREWITGRDLPTDLAHRQQQGISAWIAKDFTPEDGLGQRSQPHLKTGNYLTPWLGLQQQSGHNAQETILTDQQGNWLETATGNLWGGIGNSWYTPATHTPAGEPKILPGIQRSRLIQGLQCQNKTVVESCWDAALVKQLEWLAYSNCVIELIPIKTILRPLPTRQFPIDHPNFQQLSQVLLLGHSQIG
jgi:branched-subunit amino acid aminotransferase/4-amino-4-deoxychorismate lyase